MKSVKFLFFMVVGAMVSFKARALEVRFDCQMTVETSVNQKIVLQDIQSVILKEPAMGRAATDGEEDLSIEVFSQVNDKVQKYSTLPFSYYLTPISRRGSGGLLVEMGVYRTNNFASKGREVVFSSIREVGRDRNPLVVSFQHMALRKLNVDMVCNPDPW